MSGEIFKKLIGARWDEFGLGNAVERCLTLLRLPLRFRCSWRK
jgi:hypothetical protein